MKFVGLRDVDLNSPVLNEVCFESGDNRIQRKAQIKQVCMI